MLLGFVDQSVRDAAHPSAIGSADDALAITVLARSPHLGHVLALASLTLTRLSENPISDYRLGVPNRGVTFRPADHLGRPVPTDHTKESLMHIMAVTLVEIGVALEGEQSA